MFSIVFWELFRNMKRTSTNSLVLKGVLQASAAVQQAFEKHLGGIECTQMYLNTILCTTIGEITPEP